jgi:hypothetical protein
MSHDSESRGVVVCILLAAALALAACGQRRAVEPAPDPAPTVASEPPRFPPRVVEAARLLSDAGEGPTTAWDRLAHLADTFGHRLCGSKALEDAIDWSLEVMRQDGLEDVRREKVMVPHWDRGEEWARVRAPVDRELHVLGLGGTVDTGGQPVRAELEVVGSLAEIDRRGDELRGKVVLIDQAMPPYDPVTRDSGYGEAAEIRFDGPSRAAKAGAVALLTRSLTARSFQTPHTGVLGYADDAPRIPAAAVTIEDAGLLSRLRARGPVTIELFLGARTLPDAESGNAIGELRGREIPEEIVVVGAHSDSWDVGDGSVDDGSGVVMALEAARLLKSLGLVPRRTVRVVLFTNEENGLRGGRAYQAEHDGERHAAGIEADSGAAEPWGFGVVGSPDQVAALQRYAPLFERLGADTIEEGYAGVDLIPLSETGVLSLGIHPDGSTYFDYHHSPADTLDRIDPRHLQRNAAALALMAFILAERE